jgi:hypothetical protein
MKINFRKGRPMDDDWKYDEQAQHDPAWERWINPDTVAAKIDALFNTTLRSVPQRAWWIDQGWSRAGGDVWQPMPACGRYDPEMMWWIADMAFGWFFPDEAAVEDPAKFEIADQFVTYIGQCFVERLEAVPFNDPYAGAPLYGFGPAVVMPFGDNKIETLVSILLECAVNGFDFLTCEINALNGDKEYAERHGL